ncbi:hypothetical protein V1511DRAFT_459883, partial [Dipodascopsis uninucleata]
RLNLGGLNWDTTDETLRKYFSQFGEVLDCQVMRDTNTGRSRGFGFLTFKDSKCVNTVMVKEHILDGKIIDPKRAIPKDEQEKTSKIFVGGVAPNVTELEFQDAFTKFGRIVDASLMIDKDTGRSRGFGFITFDSDIGVDNTLAHCPLVIGGKMVEVKKAQPRGKEKSDREDYNLETSDILKNQKSNYEEEFSNDASQQGDSNLSQYAAQQSYYGSGMSATMLAKYFYGLQQFYYAMQNMDPNVTTFAAYNASKFDSPDSSYQNIYNMNGQMQSSQINYPQAQYELQQQYLNNSLNESEYDHLPSMNSNVVLEGITDFHFTHMILVN